MNQGSELRWLHRLAWLTAIIALLPISLGAVVTTVDAGMAFADWPTSHGQGMLAFPWLQSKGDEFLEHGHRLAGMLVGLVTLALTAVAFGTECCSRVRGVVAGILVGVIAQGLLGGWRVLADERVIAMLHALFAAVVFSLMALLVVMTGRQWQSEAPLTKAATGRLAQWTGIVLVLVLSIQYVLGGLLRHLGSAHAWLVHPWFALAVVIAAIGFAVACWQTQAAALRRGALLVLGLITAQALLGVVTWGVRYGFPQWDIMAYQQSSLQVAVRSLHKVLGLLTFMATVVTVVRVWKLLAPSPLPTVSLPSPMAAAGGVA